jgi:2-polyprenyl-3-methyl-5-hydroxy-6-metoxy-1,4-benzoquinol methylase
MESVLIDMKTEPSNRAACKICGSNALTIRKHTARCKRCGVLLYYPYPDDGELYNSAAHLNSESAREWYKRSAWSNHENFTRNLRFAVAISDAIRSLRVLDYGCGGGQFAVVAKSQLPFSQVFCTDISDEALLPEWRSVQTQISFGEFAQDRNRFDIVFLNNVLEHVSDPLEILRLIRSKLTPNGRIFIDTPKVFWLYPVSKIVSSTVYEQLLLGTVSLAHLQIWTRRSFKLVLAGAGLKVCKYREAMEYTMPALYYLDNMKINNRIVRFAGEAFYLFRWLSRNKIMALVSRAP